MKIYSMLLNGSWDYRIGRSGPFVKKQVPYSAHCVGVSELRKKFDCRYTGKGAVLCFEGITYRATVSLNGIELGVMLPYSRYEFDITHILRDRDNELTVIIEDIHVPFGPSEGWENYGGIIREVRIEFYDTCRILDVTWVADLTRKPRSLRYTAACRVTSEVSRPEGVQLQYRLLDRNRNIVAEAALPAGEVWEFSIDSPNLWSPDSPYRYDLETRSLIDGRECDAWFEHVGFKDFSADGRIFRLNGAPIFLVGVCRHDLYGDNGHTATYGEIRRDMELIKSAGVNFVRLVHYPHNECVLDLADELGLLVSEEPGLWWSDMHNQEICEGSLEVLRRTVKRDKNHISVAFWLSFNECIFTEEYLKDAIRVCREADPHHMVSGANCMSIDMTRDFFTKCGMDFFTMHPYAPTPDLMREHAEALGTLDRPLMFTEWGGYFVHDNPALLTRFIGYMKDLWRRYFTPGEAKGPLIAGACLWMWAEMFEFSRAEPACADGILHESLVDRYRNPGPNFEAFRRAFADINEPLPSEYKEEQTLLLADAGDTKPVPLDNFLSDVTLWKAALKDARKPIKKYYYKFKRERSITHGPVIFNRAYDEISLAGITADLLKRPIVTQFGESVTLPVNETASAIYLFGCVSLPKGWPISGEYAEEIGGVTILYADGTSTRRILKNGEDVTTVTGIFGPSRIDPRAANAPRVLSFSYDYDREQYHINLLKIPTKSENSITEISIWVTTPGYNLLTYGLSLSRK